MPNLLFARASRHSLIDDRRRMFYLQTQLLEEDVANKHQNRLMRLYFSGVVFAGVIIYVGYVLNILYRCGDLDYKFILSDTILGILLTTTTTNIIAVLVFVVRYLFPQESSVTSQNNVTESNI